jgi:myo-inositol-1(or 4)-monophosphatase
VESSHITTGVDSLIEFATGLALSSGELIAERFQSQDLGLELKPDRSVVTAADLDAEQLIRTQIGDRFPEHGIIGEEFGTENGDAEYVWTLDPIDGTISFVAGVPLFGTLIGLLHRGQPILGLIHQPILEELLIGDGDRAWLNGKPVAMRTCSQLSEATFLTTDANLFDRFKDASTFDRLWRETGQMRTWGDCYGYLMLATGRADIMLDPIMNPWDLIPLIPIVQGAGGVITDWDGNDPKASDSIVAAGPELHPQILELIR